MDITPYVENLRRDLLAAAESAGEQARQTAERLGYALDPSARLALMEAISQAAAEITAAMPSGSVDVRLDGRDLDFVVQAPQASRAGRAAPSASAGPAGPGRRRGGPGPDHAADARLGQEQGRRRRGRRRPVAQHLAGQPGPRRRPTTTPSMSTSIFPACPSVVTSRSAGSAATARSPAGSDHHTHHPSRGAPPCPNTPSTPPNPSSSTSRTAAATSTSPPPTSPRPRCGSRASIADQVQVVHDRGQVSVIAPKARGIFGDQQLEMDIVVPTDSGLVVKSGSADLRVTGQVSTDQDQVGVRRRQPRAARRLRARSTPAPATSPSPRPPASSGSAAARATSRRPPAAPRPRSRPAPATSASSTPPARSSSRPAPVTSTSPTPTTTSA